MASRQEQIVAEVLEILEARDIFQASGEHEAAGALTREVGTYPGGFVAVAMQRHAERRDG